MLFSGNWRAKQVQCLVMSIEIFICVRMF